MQRAKNDPVARVVGPVFLPGADVGRVEQAVDGDPAHGTL